MVSRKWKIQKEFKIHNSKFKIDDIVKILLENRGIKTTKQKDEFLNPKLSEVTPASVGINKIQLNKTLKRIQKAIEQQEHIVVFGDYDVDGICGSAILWETLYGLGAKALPYIPHRVDEGYGLSIHGIDNIKNQKSKIKNVRLIITVDNGIVANEAVEYANKNGIDVIITDHHVPSKKLPKAHSIVHTTKLCGTGVAYLLAKEISNFKFQISNKSKIPTDHLALVALATVADLVPLQGANRTLLTFGLEELRKTKRPGLQALFQEAVIDQKTIEAYHIGYIIAPRLNAAGRMEYAMDSLRLLCTKNAKKAQDLADTLGKTNRERQTVTLEAVAHAINRIKNQESRIRKLLFISHESYQQGVIGLVAGKLVEEFYRPAIVLSIGEKYSKASARSISGFNIIEFIRTASEHLVDAGGHPMAAGFTVETEKIALLEELLHKRANKILTQELLTRTLKIDMELPFPCIDTSLHNAVQQLAPFGMGNPEPVFVTKKVIIEDMRLIGKERQHVKFRLSQQLYSSSEAQAESRSSKEDSSRQARTIYFNAIAFGMGERSKDFHVGDTVDVVYSISEDTWNGNRKLQLKVKDIKIPS